MDPTPEELERADFSTIDAGYDPDAVRGLLRKAADRIRALERDGVKSVSASVTAVLDQAVRSGEDLVAEATRDAEAIRNAARADAERITTDAGEVAARAVADGEHRAAGLREVQVLEHGMQAVTGSNASRKSEYRVDRARR